MERLKLGLVMADVVLLSVSIFLEMMREGSLNVSYGR